MKTLTLRPDDLRVESFATGDGRDAAPALNTRTMWPKDCPETLPRFC